MFYNFFITYYHIIYFFIIYNHSFLYYFFFFFNDTATTEIYTLSLHDALPISIQWKPDARETDWDFHSGMTAAARINGRSEEHTSELQSRLHLVCRLLLEKKKKKTKVQYTI